ncbi:MAG: GNAT family N-acetyltransferase [Acidobacteriia bacterium]|nr:GNAT family N-acetyltransferase [Terriglobia bacterium]
MPGPEFFAEADPGQARCGELASLQPANPFATFPYLQAERSFGGGAWLLGCASGGELRYGCLGFLRSGRLDRRLTLPSLPPAEEPFWSGLAEFCRKKGVTILELNTFASPAVAIPSLGEERRRVERHEFVVPMDGPGDGLLQQMHPHHRRMVRKGMKAGLEVRVTRDPGYLKEHVAVMRSSLTRRESRGEDVWSEPDAELLRPYLDGVCRLFQAVAGAETVSSMTVAESSGGGYLHTAGTSPEGMRIGASHFLLYEILKACRQNGGRIFNLGGVSDLSSGLALYKRHFGAHPVTLEAAEFDVGAAWRRVVRISAGKLRDWAARENWRWRRRIPG